MGLVDGRVNATVTTDVEALSGVRNQKTIDWVLRPPWHTLEHIKESNNSLINTAAWGMKFDTDCPDE